MRDATLRLEVENCNGVERQRATAVILEDDAPDETAVAATVAHTFVVDGQLSVEDLTVVDREGNNVEARLLFIDAATDVALLSLSTPRLGLEVGTFEAPDATSRLVLYPSEESTPSVASISVVRETTATLDGLGARRALELAGSIESGDSGAPVIDDQGQVIGIVFAASTTSETGWAIAASEFEAAMAQPSRSVDVSCP